MREHPLIDWNIKTKQKKNTSSPGGVSHCVPLWIHLFYFLFIFDIWLISFASFSSCCCYCCFNNENFLFLHVGIMMMCASAIHDMWVAKKNKKKIFMRKFLLFSLCRILFNHVVGILLKSFIFLPFLRMWKWKRVVGENVEKNFEIWFVVCCFVFFFVWKKFCLLKKKVNFFFEIR